MIYNFVAYMESVFPALDFTADGFKQTSEDNVVVCKSSGTPKPWFDRQDLRVQILSRGKSQYIAKKNADLIYDNVNKKFGLLLPETTIESDTYPEVQTDQLTALQIPTYIGDDSNGLAMYSFNYSVVTN